MIEGLKNDWTVGVGDVYAAGTAATTQPTTCDDMESAEAPEPSSCPPS